MMGDDNIMRACLLKTELTKLCTDLPKGMIMNKRFPSEDFFYRGGKPRRATPILTQ